MMGDKKKKQKEEEKPSEGTGKEEHPGKTTWICPKCGTHYTGWSNLNTCSLCGYNEVNPMPGLDSIESDY